VQLRSASTLSSRAAAHYYYEHVQRTVAYKVICAIRHMDFYDVQTVHLLFCHARHERARANKIYLLFDQFLLCIITVRLLDASLMSADIIRNHTRDAHTHIIAVCIKVGGGCVFCTKHRAGEISTTKQRSYIII
jgi:hypothetical protein